MLLSIAALTAKITTQANALSSVMPVNPVSPSILLFNGYHEKSAITNAVCFLVIECSFCFVFDNIMS